MSLLNDPDPFFTSPKRKRVASEESLKKNHDSESKRFTKHLDFDQSENNSFSKSTILANSLVCGNEDQSHTMIMGGEFHTDDDDSMEIKKNLAFSNSKPTHDNYSLFTNYQHKDRKKYTKNHLIHVKNSNIFENESGWTSNISSTDEDDIEYDDNITRLLSESDPSIDRFHSHHSNKSPSHIHQDKNHRQQQENKLFYSRNNKLFQTSSSMTEDNDHLDNMWLADNINNFTRSCDLNNRFSSPSNRIPISYDQVSSPQKQNIHYNTKAKSPNRTGFSLGDFGTPMTEVGSPAILEGIEYPSGENGDDSMLVDEVKPQYIAGQFSNDSSMINQNATFQNSHQMDISSFRDSPLDYKITNTNSHFSRPLPDLSAFDDSNNSHINQSFDASPQCPPTPMRNAFWAVESHEEEDDEEEDSFSKNFHMSSLPALIRQNSLGDNKLLLAQSESPTNEIFFLRDFIIEGLIGSGTFAEVYKVKSKLNKNDQHFAVKKIKRQFRSKKDREWLLNEVRFMKQVGESECPYVVPFVRAWQEDSYFYVQLGLAEKGSLKDAVTQQIINKHTLPDSTLWHVLHDTAAGLHHIHSCNVVHLDIKPANLLITNQGIIQIGDFGMASNLGSIEEGHEGDNRYMAPELLNSYERLPSADLFSLGLTIYELCYTRDQIEKNNVILPSDGPNWHKLRKGNPDLIVGRPNSLTNIVYSLMNPDPSSRMSTKDIISSLDVISNNKLSDPILLNSKPAPMQRSTLNLPTFCPILQISTQIDPVTYQEMLDRAITPH